MGLASQAAAYVLPASYILHELAKARRDMNIRDMTITLETHYGDPTETISERLYMKAPASSRRQDDAEPPQVHIQKKLKHAAGTEGSLRVQSGPLTELLPLFLLGDGKDLDNYSANARRALEHLGIDVKKSSMSRRQERIVYIIGATPHEKDKPQLWLDKHSYRPLRYIYYLNEDGKEIRYEMVFEDWASTVTNNLFPRITELWRDGKMIRHSEVEDLQTNQRLPDSLFVLPRS